MTDRNIQHGSVFLSSSDLFSKWGFRDGDLLQDCELPAHVDEHATLIELVRRHLLPALPRPVEVYEISSNHNPIRAEDEEVEDFQPVEVWVSPHDVEQAAFAVAARAARPCYDQKELP